MRGLGQNYNAKPPIHLVTFTHSCPLDRTLLSNSLTLYVHIHTCWHLVCISLPLLLLIEYPDLDSDASCPRSREEAAARGRQCLRKCRTDADCISSRKRCLCDGLCGWSCLRPGKSSHHHHDGPSRSGVTVGQDGDLRSCSGVAHDCLIDRPPTRFARQIRCFQNLFSN